MSRYPFGIPNGWYLIAYSDELAAGALLRLQRLGRELVAFRGESGRVSVICRALDMPRILAPELAIAH